MPELDSITIKGFKSIASIEDLKLGAINLIIGPNGSGKSNFIGAFSFLHAINEGHLQDYVAKIGGADKVLHFGAKTTSKLEIRIAFEPGINEYEVWLEPTPRDQLVLRAKVGNNLARLARNLNCWRLYHFVDTSATSPLKMTADINDNRFLRPDGSNLAAFLYYLRHKHESSYHLIQGVIRQVAPFFDDFVLEPLKLNPNTIQLEWRHKGSDAYFDASSLSDGTLRFIALATLFLQPESDRPSVILVDEPELGLHPRAITLLASMVKQASVTTQVIISTQSPLLLDHFQPEDVLVADRVNGGTQLTRLDSAKLQAWLEDYSLGQLWEKNELGGRPRGE